MGEAVKKGVLRQGHVASSQQKLCASVKGLSAW
jgi:hypothetical protein